MISRVLFPGRFPRRARALAAGLVLAAAGPGRAAPAESAAPVAPTTAGQIRGFVDRGIFGFKGVPYGADTAPRRFQAPVPPEPWTGVRDCLAFGPLAPQAGSRYGEGPFSEDCLRLNVWTPGLGDGRRRPVLVYFHGGAYDSGTVNRDLYDGVNLCRRGDVVVVTVNHRLNGFGFLYLAELGGPAYADSGNAGMLDLVLALRWVHDNITAFGGDPGCVTIFGQSGGGAKCATLMAMPAAHGLFQRVWTMSGQQLTGRTRAHATATAKTILEKFNLTPEHVDELQRLPLDQLANAMRGEMWAPVVDGTVLPRDPFEPDASPVSADVPMVLGNTHDETTYLIGRGDPSTFDLTWRSLPAKLRQQVGRFLGELTPDAVVAAYRGFYPEDSPSDIFFAASTAARSWKGMVLESEQRARQGGAPTYVYYLNWESPVDGGRWKAPHTLDIPLVFDNVAAGAAQTGTGPGAQEMADLMSGALLAFARTGNPATPQLPAWPRFELEHRPAMIFDLPLREEDDPRGAERRFFAPVPYVQPGT